MFDESFGFTDREVKEMLHFYEQDDYYDTVKEWYDGYRFKKLFTEYMKKTISVRDTFVRKSTKENFYHGILLGILSFKGGWMVKFNKEAGDGFSDIMIWIDDLELGIVIEVKYAEADQMEAECQKALRQIEGNKYEEVFQQDDIHTVLKYGIACNRRNVK